MTFDPLPEQGDLVLVGGQVQARRVDRQDVSVPVGCSKTRAVPARSMKVTSLPLPKMPSPPEPTSMTDWR